MPHLKDEGLTLTVHPLPTGLPARTSRISARLKLLLLGVVCVAPVVASYLTYYVIRPEGRRNHGELISPQVPTPSVIATTADGNSINLQALKGQWLLVSVAGGSCNATCQQNLYLQRQIREASGKDSDRIDWVWLINDAATIPEPLQPALKTATVLRADPSQIEAWLKPTPGSDITSHIYVVDPLGNWMMRFPANMDIAAAAKAKRDIAHLLKASSFWDRAGRP